MEKTLLNLFDIKQRLIDNPEPKEVTDARKLITESFSKLQFVEDVHKYYIPNGRGKKKIELPSVSSIIKRWEPEVDWDEKAEQKALKMGISSDELKKQWHENNIISTSCGSKTHFFGENAMNMFIGREDLTKKNMAFQYTDDGYLIPYCAKEKAITKYYLDILNNPNVYPVMPEAKIYTNYNDTFNMKQPYAGTFDILLAYRYKGKIVFSLQDFKTNMSLYKDYARSNGQMMLSPFDDLYDEPYSHYSLQLSLYSLGLKQIGIDVIDRVIIWLKDDGTYEKIKTPDLTEKLIPLL